MAVLRSCGSRWVQSRPAMRIWPSVGSSKPEIMRSVVVLPQPDGPMKEMYSPCAMWSVISSTARMSRPKRLVTLIRSTAISLLIVPPTAAFRPPAAHRFPLAGLPIPATPLVRPVSIAT